MHYFNQGHTAEMLLCEYPGLTLSTIYKVIAFYLDNRTAVDAYICQSEAETRSQRALAAAGPGIAELRSRLSAARSASD